MAKTNFDWLVLNRVCDIKIIILGLVMSAVLATSCSGSKTVTISGEFPEEVDAYAKITVEKKGDKWRYSLPIKEGRYEFELDSLETAIYDLSIEWSAPFDKRYRTLRNDEGEIVKEYQPKGYWEYKLGKRIYINPEQSKHYHVKFENDVTGEMIYELAGGATGRAGDYRLKVISESEDALLFDRLDSITNSYTKGDYSLILDSLFEASDRNNKLPRDFSSLARKLNLNNNYVPFVNKKMALVEGDLDNPVAVLAILNVDRRLMVADLDKYERLLEGISGRAKASPLYDSLSRTISELSDPLKVGDEIPAPTGHTPDYAPEAFDPGDHRYSAVVFWASWSPSSRRQNEQWNNLLSRYGSKGFQVLGLSTDENIDDWRDAIRYDGLGQWFHLSDMGQGFSGNNVLRYGVRAVPFTVLIDQQGRIVLKGVDPEAVEVYLEENL